MSYTRRPQTVPKSSYSYVSLSADNVASNDDLLLQILIRLLIKSLLKFKCVSKRWLSLISNPDFSGRLSSKPKPVSALFLRAFPRSNPVYDFLPLDHLPTSARPPFRSLTFINKPSRIMILQSCNGLLLCCTANNNEAMRECHVYNPTTKQYTTLPQLSRRHGSGQVLGMNIAFDPSKSPCYKVVCFQICDSTRQLCRIQIYSSETGPWRLSGKPFELPDSRLFDRGVFWIGALHWICQWGPSLYFDVEEEKLLEMPMPPLPDDLNQSRRVRYFGESRGHLHLVELYGPRASCFHVYEMEGNYGGWFVKYNVDLDNVVAAFPDMARIELDYLNTDCHGFSVLYVVRKEDEDESYIVLHIPGKAIRYNFKDRTFKTLCDFAPDPHESKNTLKFQWLDAHKYIEALSCV